MIRKPKTKQMLIFAALLFASSAFAQTIVLGYADDAPIAATDARAVAYNSALNAAMLKLHNACRTSTNGSGPCWTAPLAIWRTEITQAGATYYGVVNTPGAVSAARAATLLAQVPPLPRPITTTPPPPTLTAAFTWSCPSITCTFDASTSSGTIVSYAWDLNRFPDPAASGKIVSPTYPHAGPRIVVLTVTDSAGRTAAVTKTVTVGSAP